MIVRSIDVKILLEKGFSYLCSRSSDLLWAYTEYVTYTVRAAVASRSGLNDQDYLVLHLRSRPQWLRCPFECLGLMSFG